jgi:DNA gyrase subunit A
MSYFIFMFCFT